MLIDQIEMIARDQQNLRQNLQNARPPIKEIIFFCFSSHVLDLPTELDDRSFGDIGHNPNPRADALQMESAALTRVFVASQNPDLDRSKRIKILKEILRCMTQRERQFLLNIIRTRTIAGIPREAVVEAFGEDWLKPRRPYSRTVMPRVAAANKTDRRPEYTPFQELKKLGYVQ